MSINLRQAMIATTVAGATFVLGYMMAWTRAPAPGEPQATQVAAVPAPQASPVAGPAMPSAPAAVAASSPAIHAQALPPQSAPRGFVPATTRVASPAPNPSEGIAARPPVQPRQPPPAITPPAAATEASAKPAESADSHTIVAASPPTQSPAPSRASQPAPPNQAAPVATPAAAPISGGPRITFDKAVYDFGSAAAGDVAAYEFGFRNTGDAQLVIGKVTTGCGCTAALVSDKELAPGASGRVKVTFNTGGYKGKVHKRVYVQSNDPTQPRVTLTMNVEVKVEIDVSPGYIYIASIVAGETATRTVTVTGLDGRVFRITKVSGTPAIQVGDPKQVADGKYEIEVTVKPERVQGALSGLVTIETDSKRHPKLYVSVGANVRNPA